MSVVPGANSSSIPMLDVTADNAPLQDELVAAAAPVLRSGHYIGGPECAAFEQQFAEYCRCEHAIGCASGSDALLLALMAIDLQPGDEVILPSFTFFATASAVWRLGATPIFADISPTTFNLDPAQLEDLVSDYTKAIIPVHLFGQSAEMNSILNFAAAYDLHVIEDACQAFGATYHDQRVGSMGHIGCFSFYPTKNLGGFGDGGMLTTNDAQLAARLRRLANHGMQPRYYHVEVGINSRLDAVQAAWLRGKLPYVNGWNDARRANAERYAQLFAQHELTGLVDVPQSRPDCGHVWNQYTIRVPDGRRDALRQKLSEAGIGSEIYYPVPLHKQACFSTLDYEPDSLRETERAAAEVLSLPIYPQLGAENQARVVRTIAECLADLQTQKRVA